MIPAGKAIIMMPVMMVAAAITRPIGVTGMTSPYPMVPSVTIAHHIASGMVPNLSGCTLPSARYINDPENRAAPNSKPRQPNSARRSAYMASSSELMPGE